MIPQFKSNIPEALKLYKETGYHIEYNIIADEIANSLIEEAHKMQDQINPTYTPIMMPHRHSERFTEFMRHPKIVDIMSILIEKKISALQSQFFFTKPGTQGFSAHQDNFYVEANPEYFASAWTALTDVRKDNGGLYLYPGSHKLGKLPIRTFNKVIYEGQDPNANDQETIVPEGSTKIFPVIPKGSVLFLHSQVVHGSGINQSASFRYAVLNTYIKQGAHFRAGKHAKRAEIKLNL